MVGKKIIASLAVFALAIGAVITAPVTANAGILDSGSGSSDLGELFVLDRLFGGDDTNANLGDIFILDQLFNDGTSGESGGILDTGSGSSDLGELFVLDRRLFGNGDNANLGDIFILDQLFGGDAL